MSFTSPSQSSKTLQLYSAALDSTISSLSLHTQYCTAPYCVALLHNFSFSLTISIYCLPSYYHFVPLTWIGVTVIPRYTHQPPSTNFTFKILPNIFWYSLYPHAATTVFYCTYIPWTQQPLLWFAFKNYGPVSTPCRTKPPFHIYVRYRPY